MFQNFDATLRFSHNQLQHVASAYPGTLSIATFLKLQTGLGACLGILSRCLGLFVKIRARADEYERRARERKERQRERQQQRKTRFASI